MQLQTIISIKPNALPITYHSKIVLLGSCFAQNMAEKFNYYQFQYFSNPFGIVFNPVSITNIINRICKKEYFTENDIFFHNEQWHCFEIHSICSQTNKFLFLNQLNQLINIAETYIKQASHFIITYGTAWVYRNKNTNQIVANCHKIPQKEFTKELLSVNVIEENIANTIEILKQINPKIQLLFTISPVRHIKDGFVENQRSKSHIISALHKKNNQTYFPSYEIMMDELRDYRFYANDMLHPSALAVDYIWEKFKETQISTCSFETMKTVESIRKSLEHKPFNKNSTNHQQFYTHLQEKIAKLVLQYPHIKF